MTDLTGGHSGGFWAWSGRIYQREGVKAACLAFQGAGGDVNVALWCCWLAARARTPSPSAVKHAAALSQYVQDEVLTPMRQARDTLKQPPVLMESEGASDARNQLLDTELDLEQLQQEALERMETVMSADGPPKDRALDAIMQVLSAIDPARADAARTSATQLLDAIFKHALYTLTRVSTTPGGEAANVVEQTLDEAALRAKLADLQDEHRALEAAIDALEAGKETDQLKVARLKKRKLQLKDEIAAIEDELSPDIIA